jgi:Undecaprenyl-phosphate galactose phosphotransferase WbaP
VHNDIKTITPSGECKAPALALEFCRTGYRKTNWWLVAGDALGLTLAWLLSLGLLWLVEDRIWQQGIIEWWAALGRPRTLLFVGLTALVLLLFGARGHYSRRRPFFDEVLDILIVFLGVAVLDALLVYLAKWQFSRSWFITAWLFALVFVPLARVFLKRSLIRARQWQRSTVIVGVGANAREAAEALYGEPLMGLEVVAFLSLPGEPMPGTAFAIGGRSIPVVPLSDNPYSTLDELGSPQVIVALEAENLYPHQKLLQKLSARYSDMSIIPPLRGLPLYGMEMTHFFSHEVLMLSMRNNLARPGPRFVKRLFDLVASVLLLLMLAPVFAIFSWKIRQSDGDAIFGHVRVGRHGRQFRCLKFRTMVPNADQVLAELLEGDPQARADWERDFKLKRDPRITPIGAFLRATSLDELPQLWNVVKGEMSLVGPRPIIEEELERYGDHVGYYLEAPPGMTGLWQISGRNDTGYDDRVALDCWYVRNWSLWYDLVILVKTVGVVFARKGAY